MPNGFMPPLTQRLKLGSAAAVQQPKEDFISEPVEYGAMRGPITEKELREAASILKDYKAGKANLESRIVEEERWWKLRHWDVIRGGEKNTGERPEPASAWLFNSIANKHADIMDNYPEPNVLPREPMDEADAKTLSSILPVIFERCNYEETYSDAGWYKLKHGVVAKGVFWNNELEDGLGDIDIRFMDLLNVFWEPGVTRLEASRNLFVVDLQDNDLLAQQYPQLKHRGGGKIIDVKQYVYDDTVDTSKKSLVVDWYYKRRTPGGRTVLHYCKFVGDTLLFASENQPEKYPNGFYDHGQYPVKLDVLFPEEGTPVGFGYIAIMRSPQLYIDKLSQVILENSMMAARVRYFAKKNVGVNLEQFLDWSRPIVDVEGDISEERLQPITVQPVSGNVLNVLQMKIDELKETSSNRDVSQGSSSGGVTAAAAIAALQEAGNKTSRDMISASYRAYVQECYLAIELIRQFYDQRRSFRITGETGEFQYIRYSNAALQGQPLHPAYPGQEREPGYAQATRRPVFDVVVRAQKRSPYSKMAQNELAKELYQLGFFNPQLAEQSLAAMDLMEFDGDEKVRAQIQKGQTLMNQLAQLQQQMAALMYQVTGQAPAGGQAAAGEPMHGKEGGRTMGRAQKEAQTAAMTDYGRKLAKNAVPSVE